MIKDIKLWFKAKLKNHYSVYLQINKRRNSMKKEVNIPEGSSVVSPYMIVESVEKELAFLKRVFNAEIKYDVKDAEGFISHSEVRIGDSTIMLGRANQNFPPTESMIYVYVDNADDVYEKALKEGAASLMKPEDRFYGNREGGVKDIYGNTWWIAQYIRTVPQEEIEQKMKEMSTQG
jgi:PhnB protein